MQRQPAIEQHRATSVAAALLPALDFRAVYQSLPVPAGILDADFAYIDFNTAFASLLGYSRTELIGQPSSRIVSPESVDAVRATRDSYLAGETTATIAERVLQTRSGQVVTVVIHMTVFETGAGRNYLVVFTEVDKLREREKLLIGRAELFRVAIDQSPLPLTIQDANYRLVLVNQAYCKMSGYSEQELLGRDPIELQSEPHHAKILKRRRDGPAEIGKSVDFISELITKSGDIVPFRLLTHRTLGVEGTKLLFCVAEDLSQIESARAKLESQSNWLIRVFDQSPVGLLLTDSQGDEFRSNSALQSMVGTDNEEVLRKLLPKEIDMDGRDPMTIVNTRIALRKPGRETQWLARTTSRVMHPDGHARFFTMVSDVTVEQQLQADLQSSVAQQSALLHTMDAGIAQVVNDLIVRVNPALVNLCNKDEDSLLGQPIEVLFEEPGQWVEICGDPAIGKDSPAKAQIVKLRGRSGMTRRCEVSVRRVDPMRVDLGLLLTINDVSDLLDQNDDLSRSLAELEDVIDTEPLGFAQIAAGKMLRVNRAMRLLMQCDANELIGREFDTFCDQPDEFLRFMQSATPRDDGPHTTRVTIVGARGLRTDCVLHITPSGEPKRQAFMVLALDLSSQARVASLALKMRNRFEVFSSLLDEAMVVVENSTGQIIHANAAVSDVFGLEPDSVLGSKSSSLWTHLIESDQIIAASKLQSLSSGQVNWSVVRILHPKSGSLSLRLRMFVGEGARESFILAEDITASLESEQERIDDAVAQKDNLVREVHHRIKNNLQGVAGLLQQSAIREPQLAGILSEVVGQIHAVAQVHGLQIRDHHLLPEDVVRAISDNLQNTFGHEGGIVIHAERSSFRWLVPEQEAVPLALVINEIVTNAFKHGAKLQPVNVTILSTRDSIAITVRNIGELPLNFDLSSQPVSPNGLGLIKALMPRRGAQLSLMQIDEHVETTINLRPPAVGLFGPEELGVSGDD